MTKLPNPALLLLALAVPASCGAEPPAASAAPVVVDLPRPVAAEPPPPPAGPAPESVAVAAEEEPVSYHCAGGQFAIAGDRPYCVQRAWTSFHESEAWCAANGGHLARIGSGDENDRLWRALASPVGFETSAWFGLVKPPGKQWTWSTGAPVVFTNWASGEPNNLGGNEDCGELYPKTAWWNDLDCHKHLRPMCASRPARPGAAPPKMQCPPSSAEAFTAGGIDYCYLRALLSSWTEAERQCKSVGGALASFRSDEEVSAFREAINGRFIEARYWIGFTDEGHEGRWTTVTGTRMTYAHWRAGEPNNAGGNEHCAEWLTEDGGWNDVRCDVPHAGICTPR